MNKVACFNREIGYIKKEHYRDNIKRMIELLPDYFFSVPASSTGKYHPEFSLGDGGLVRHTKVAVKIAYELLNDESIGHVFNDDEKDMIIMSLIMHDGLKSGLIKGTYTVFDHPLLVCKYIVDNKDKLTLNDDEINLITNMISSHMGPWNTNNYSDVVLPKPSNKYQRFVHMCDFLASRKFLNVNFKDNDIVE